MAEPDPDQFRIDPLVVFKLGEELVSDEIQALLELIKNAYDADASFVRVSINTTGMPNELLIQPDKKRPGWIEITDDGVGMDDQSIRNGWLVIARSDKRDFKKAGKVTAKKRTPLGDKGLGRLGAQRLGRGLQIATKTAGAKTERVLAFSWEDFMTAPTLDKVEIKSKHQPTTRQSGTVLTISELQEPERWNGDGIAQLQRELSEVISPYEGVSGFTVAVSVNGVSLDLQSLGKQIRDTALLHYDITFKNKKLEITGRATLGLFRPNSKKQAQQYHELVEQDRGDAFFQHLIDAGAKDAVKLGHGQGRWFATFKLSRKLADLNPALDSEGEPGDPGPFAAEVDAFSLAPGDDATSSVFGKLQEYRNFIKDLAGVRVYRDGFVVRTDKDWLKLGGQWTTGGSYYGLKPETTLGYVAISSSNNAQLVEKTDREGFIDNAAYRNFDALMSEFVNFTGEVQELLRREYLEFAKATAAAAAEVADDLDPEEVSDAIDSTLNEAHELQKSAAAAQTEMSKALETSTETIDAPDDTPPDELIARSDRAAKTLRGAMASAQGTLEQLTGFLARVETAQSQNRVLREEIKQMSAQLEAGVEAMGLGLTAEALSHEMFTIADGLATRTQDIASKVAEQSLDDRDVRRYVEYVRGSVGALRTELSHFAPGLRYVRDRRDKIDMLAFSTEIAEYYGSRWHERPIRVTVSDDSPRPFLVRGSRGKLTQTLDNLLLNSGYWVGVALDQGAIKAGQINIELRRPFVSVRDNGPGVEPSVETSLFDAFVTRKPRGVGRGLGLFIVRQLLESDDCTIALGPQRGKDKRPREFVVNLEGILDDS
jgi:signal transduction histidine kinase